MDKSRSNVAVHPELLQVQAVIITEGPYEGRIGENDDNDFVAYFDFNDWEKEAYAQFFGWSEDEEFSKSATGFDYEPLEFAYDFGAYCEIIYFGNLITTDFSVRVPTLAVRPATMHDLVKRKKEIDEILLEYRFSVSSVNDLYSDADILDLMREHQYIIAEIWNRETMASEIDGGAKVVFLCHSSNDKPLVRMVRNDLAARGFSPWIDEFEINVGDSIVEKIAVAHENASAIIVFLSKSSIESGWVKKEWQSGLMRKLGGIDVALLPARIDNTELPALLSDIMYADFRDNYEEGLSALFKALKNNQ